MPLHHTSCCFFKLVFANFMSHLLSEPHMATELQMNLDVFCVSQIILMADNAAATLPNVKAHLLLEGH